MNVNAVEYPSVRWARELPNHPAVVFNGNPVTYFDLAARIERCAAWLQAKSVSLGHRVIVSSANSLEWVVVIHALARLGAVHVPIGARILKSQADEYRRLYSPVLVLTDRSTASLWSEPTLLEELAIETDSTLHGDLASEIDRESLHSIVQTSGSEGEPKGACLSFRNHLSSALASALNLGVRPDDRWLLNMPMDRIGGLAIVMRAAIYGTTVVIHDRFDADQVWRSIDNDGVSQLSCVASTLRRILDAAPERQCPDHVRTLMVGGGPVPESLMDEARGRGFPVLPTYGLTETSSQIATLSPASPDSKRYTAGVALPLVDIEIRDESGSNVPSGTIGRIHVRGPMVSSGYWIKVGRIEMSLDSDGWLATNDIGSIDDDGFLTVHGRVDNVIISGGIKTHAEEIENVLTSRHDVAHAVVIAIEDSEWGQSPMAIVELETGCDRDEAELRKYLAEHLPKHKMPRRFEFVDAIPMLPSGKADRQLLRSRYRT